MIFSVSASTSSNVVVMHTATAQSAPACFSKVFAQGRHKVGSICFAAATQH
jgi:hypothetical protein